MLVLTRRMGEKIVIGENILTVVRVEGARVKLGIVAPVSVPVRRGEIQSSHLSVVVRKGSRLIPQITATVNF